MHKIWLARSLILFATGTVWSQQKEAPGTPQAQPSTSSTAQGKHGKHAQIAVPPVCPDSFNDSLATDGIVGKDTEGVMPPKLKRAPEAEFSDEARRYLSDNGIRSFDATSAFYLVVNVDGKPEDLCIKKAAGYGLDLQATKALLGYRFAPATKDARPVPMRISIDVTFHWY